MSAWKSSEYIKILSPYADGGKPSCHIESMRFPGGEINVRCMIPSHNGWCLWAILKDSGAIMELMLATDALRRAGVKIEQMELLIPYFPYARQDRVCNKGEALSLKVMADLVNSLGYDSVVIYDPHSDVTAALIHNVECHHQSEWVPRWGEADFIVSPDAGAEKKAVRIAKAWEKPLIIASKVRDIKTGDILETRLDCDDLTGKSCLIVDDICDGGRTFIELARALRIKGANRISLHVTHGIFSQGFDVFNGLIDRITYTNSLNQTDGQHPSYLNIKEIF